MRIVFLIFTFCVFVAPGSVWAESVEPTDDFKQRLDLARDMHKLQSSKDQVNAAIDSVALRLPQTQQENFKNNMRRVLSYRTIEDVSVHAMAETFTVNELRAMIAYYATEEAKSIAEKYPAYQAKVSPEIMKMLDKAMMRIKTGSESP